MGVNYEWGAKYFMFIDTEHLNYIDFDEVFETSPETMRYSNEESETFVKWMGNPPETVLWLKNTYDYSIITKEEALKILRTDEWISDVNE
jgi:hypothetical protein